MAGLLRRRPRLGPRLPAGWPGPLRRRGRRGRLRLPGSRATDRASAARRCAASAADRASSASARRAAISDGRASRVFSASSASVWRAVRSVTRSAASLDRSAQPARSATMMRRRLTRVAWSRASGFALARGRRLRGTGRRTGLPVPGRRRRAAAAISGRAVWAARDLRQGSQRLIPLDGDAGQLVVRGGQSGGGGGGLVAQAGRGWRGRVPASVPSPAAALRAVCSAVTAVCDAASAAGAGGPGGGGVLFGRGQAGAQCRSAGCAAAAEPPPGSACRRESYSRPTARSRRTRETNDWPGCRLDWLIDAVLFVFDQTNLRQGARQRGRALHRGGKRRGAVRQGRCRVERRAVRASAAPRRG